MEGPDDLEFFDESAYLSRYPDVAQAVGRKIFPSGQYHYQRHGFREGRIGTKIQSVPTVNIDPGNLFKTLKNPPIRTHAPKVFGIEKMRPDFRAMYDVLWNQDRPESPIKCFVLEDVIVAGEGIVFDNQGRVFAETIHQSSSHDVEQSFRLVSDLLSNNDSDIVPGTALLCAKAGVKNYGHWLFEMLPIAFLFEKESSHHNVVVPTVSPNNGMNAVIEDSLDLIGVTPSRVRRYSAPQRFEKLVVMLGLSHHGSFYSPHAIDAFDRMVEQVEGRGAERIWVSRVRTARRLAEEREVCETLESRGWVIASPEDMSLREQIALFKDATVVAGVNGAGLTNIAFSRVGLKIISFVPEQMPDIFFWMLSQFKGQHFSEVRCDQESLGSGEFNWQCRLMLSAEQTLDYIDSVVDAEKRNDTSLVAITSRELLVSTSYGIDLDTEYEQIGKESPMDKYIPNAHTGLDYHDFMASLSHQRSTKRYLEVGVQAGVLMNRITAELAVGVDPDFIISANVTANKKKTCLIQATSDDFFADPFQVAQLSAPPDLIFLDGFHTFEFLLRDFYNSEAISKPDTVIVLHDCLPLDDIMTIRDIPVWRDKMRGTRFEHYWTGDVWKIIPILQKFRGDLEIKYVDCMPTGLVLISKLDPGSRILIDNYDEIVRDFDNIPNSAEYIGQMYSTIKITPAADAMQDRALFVPAKGV